LVDVRDVATAHVIALLSAAAPGERFLTSAHDCWYRDIAQILRQGGHKVPTWEVPNWLVHVVSWFDPTARLVLDDLGKSYQLETDKIRRLLGWHPRALPETILDTAGNLLIRKNPH
jgi:dihydroflavonol-4-reductase